MNWKCDCVHFSEKRIAVEAMVKMNSFLGIGLEPGIKIFSLVLLALHCTVAGVLHDYYTWTTGDYILEVILASLSAIALVLAFSTLQWNKTKELLIPATVMAPILSLVSLVYFIVLVAQSTSAVAILIDLLYLLEAILAAYFWVGLLNLYDLKIAAISAPKPSSPSTHQPAPYYHSGLY